MQPDHKCRTGRGKILRGRGIGAGGRLRFIPAVKRCIPQPVSSPDQSIALRFGQLCTAIFIGDNARGHTGQQCQAVVGCNKAGCERFRIRLAVCIKQQCRRMPFSHNPAHRVIHPRRSIHRQEEGRLPARALQRIQNIRRIGIRRPVKRQINVCRLLCRLLLHLRDGRLGRCLRRLLVGRRIGIGRIRLSRIRYPKVCIDRTFDLSRLGSRKTGITLRRSVGHTQDGFPRDRYGGIAKSELAAAQSDRNIDRAVQAVGRRIIAVQVLVIDISLIQGKAERFPVRTHTEHAFLAGGGYAKRGKHTVRNIVLAAHAGGHGAVLQRQERIIHCSQCHRSGRHRHQLNHKRRAYQCAEQFFQCAFNMQTPPFSKSYEHIIANRGGFVTLNA